MDKFAMTQKQNLAIAERLLPDSICKSANLEGIRVSYRRRSIF